MGQVVLQVVGCVLTTSIASNTSGNAMVTMTARMLVMKIVVSNFDILQTVLCLFVVVFFFNFSSVNFQDPNLSSLSLGIFCYPTTFDLDLSFSFLLQQI